VPLVCFGSLVAVVDMNTQGCILVLPRAVLVFPLPSTPSGSVSEARLVGASVNVFDGREHFPSNKLTGSRDMLVPVAHCPPLVTQLLASIPPDEQGMRNLMRRKRWVKV
jgi:hypothetical protein